MSENDALLRNISDTARWTAFYRARESERSDALFRDPFARRLAGERGEQIAKSFKRDRSWAFVVRTHLFDELVRKVIAHGTDTILNLAAGLDTRPYRMDLPSSLRWIEVDLPELMEYKKEMLKDASPHCYLERVPMDLTNREQRRALFQRVGETSSHVLTLSEGILIYFEESDVAELAQDLAGPQNFQHWAIDLASPSLLRMMQGELGPQLERASSPLKFAPQEGPDFFAKYGWKPIVIESNVKAAARFKRGPLLLRLLSLFPDSKGRAGKGIWGGVLLLGR
jgi:methyltransferase (TIGR00027 family)